MEVEIGTMGVCDETTVFGGEFTVVSAEYSSTVGNIQYFISETDYCSTVGAYLSGVLSFVFDETMSSITCVGDLLFVLEFTTNRTFFLFSHIVLFSSIMQLRRRRTPNLLVHIYCNRTEKFTIPDSDNSAYVVLYN